MLMRSPSEIIVELQQTTTKLCLLQARTLGALEISSQQAAKQFHAIERSIQRKYDANYSSALLRKRRIESIRKQRILNVIDQLIGVSERPELRVAEYIQLGSITKDDQGLQTVPLIVPLFGHGNLCYDFRRASPQVDIDSMIRFVEGRALESTALFQLKIVSYDPFLRNLEAPFVDVHDESFSAIRYIHSPKLLDAFLDELTDHVSHIANNYLVNASTLVDYHNSTGVCVDTYYLVIMHDYPRSISPSQHERLIALSRASCPTGLSFVFELSAKADDDCRLDLMPLIESCTVFTWETEAVTWRSHPGWNIVLSGASQDDAKRATKSALAHLSVRPSAILPISDVLPIIYWQESSFNGISFTLGKDGNELVEVTLGSKELQLHNAVITGAVGKGKSNLIKSIIYELCSRYSPDELELYLLDFKEGVTLYPMAPTSDSPEYLPHARVIALEADQDFGISVLEELIGIGLQRARVIKPYGDNIYKYRTALPKAVMPRILLVIDEFQLFLSGEGGSRATALLVQAARTLRSYGIHILLASQSLGGITALLADYDKFYAQFPVRIGLKNSPSESRATFGPLNEAAAHLRFQGEAILNDDYGLIEANRKVLTPLADDAVVRQVREKISRLDAGRHAPPCVFCGNVLPRFADVVTVEWNNGSDSTPQVFLGRTLSVSQAPVSFSLDSFPGRNLAIVGNGNDASDPEACNLGIALVLSAIRSLAIFESSINDELLILNLLSKGDALSLMLRDEIAKSQNSFYKVQVLETESSREWVKSFLSGDVRRSAKGRMVVIALGMDRLGTFDMGTQSQIANRIRDAPLDGMHFIPWWYSSNALSGQMGLSGISSFDGVVLLFGTANLAKQLSGPLCNWNGETSRVLYKDMVSGIDAAKLVPFGYSTSELIP